MEPTLRVLFISGYTGSAIARHGVLESDVPFLEKPFTPDAVACKVREALDRGLPAVDVARRAGGS